MDEIHIYKRPRLKNPYLIAAWPGMGEVAFKAATYIVEKLKGERIAEIAPEKFFYLTESVVTDGVVGVPALPANTFYVVRDKAKKHDLVVFIGQAQPDLAAGEEYCALVTGLAKSLRIKKVITLAAMPQPIDHNQDPRVWFTATSKSLVTALKKFHLEPLSSGQISGLNGLFLGLAAREGFEGFCLLGEIPLYTIQIENPKASHAVLAVLSKILALPLELEELREQSSSMEGQINGLLEYLKVGPQSPGPIGDEEIEKIRKTLSQLTKLPASVKERIESLFTQAKTDISKARQLKAELDSWNVYKEYEDRFLDLFRKAKGGGNQ